MRSTAHEPASGPSPPRSTRTLVVLDGVDTAVMSRSRPPLPVAPPALVAPSVSRDSNPAGDVPGVDTVPHERRGATYGAVR